MRLGGLIAVFVMLALSPAYAQQTTCGTQSAQGTCCCTQPNGIQCCGMATICGSGIISGCACSSIRIGS